MSTIQAINTIMSLNSNIIFNYEFSRPEVQRNAKPISIKGNILVAEEDGKTKNFKINGIKLVDTLPEKYTSVYEEVINEVLPEKYTSVYEEDNFDEDMEEEYIPKYDENKPHTKCILEEIKLLKHDDDDLLPLNRWKIFQPEVLQTYTVNFVELFKYTVTVFTANTIDDLYIILKNKFKLIKRNKQDDLQTLKTSKFIAIDPYIEEIGGVNVLLGRSSLVLLEEEYFDSWQSF
jgi:hypothetical protein